MGLLKEGAIDLAGFKNYMQSGELHELSVDTPFIEILTRLDSVLFPKKGEMVSRGWRNTDVYVGWYMPPSFAAVPHLLEIYADKAQSLLHGENHYVRTEDYTKLVAWACWMLVNIHPKQDGNGRLAQAVAEYLMPDRHILGYRDQAWEMAFNAADLGIIDAIAKKQGRGRPEVPLTPANEEKRKLWWVDYGGILRDFYRYQGRDWSAEFLEDAINETAVDDKGKFKTAGISLGALGLMEEFLQRVPFKKPISP